MRKDKDKATKLRSAGHSYKDISKKLGVPKSTLSDWFKDDAWSQDIKASLSAKAILESRVRMTNMSRSASKRWEIWRQSARDSAVMIFPQLKSDSLFISGIMLYWGEGDRKAENGAVRLANSDPAMIYIFFRFLKVTLNVPEDKISLWLLLYPDLIDNVQKNFWSKATGVSLEHFKKSIYIMGKHPTKRLAYGVCNIVVNSRELKEKVLKWIELYKGYFHSI